MPAEDTLPPWEALVPEGWNPDDYADYEDGMAFWRQEAQSLNALMDENGNIPGMRELPSPTGSFRTARATESDFASCVPSRAPSEFQDAQSEAPSEATLEVFGTFNSPPPFLSSVAASSHDFPSHVSRGEDPRTSRVEEQWGEDPRTSRTQQRGEDPRTSKVD